MAIIGQNLPGTAAPNVNATSMHGSSDQHYIAVENQEVFKFAVYQGNDSNAGNLVEIGIYDVTDGIDNALLVGLTRVVDGTNFSAEWREVELVGDQPFPLIDGRHYAVGIDTEAWTGHFNGWTTNNTLRMTGQDQLPQIFHANSSSYSGALSFYAETRPFEGSVEITEFNNGNAVSDGDTNALIEGANFSGGGNVVTITLFPSIDDESAVIQSSISGQSPTSITIDTVELPLGASSRESIYIFVTNIDLVDSAPFEARVAEIESYLHTLPMREPGGAPSVCIATDLAEDMIAYKNRGTGSEELALTIEPLTGAPSADIQFLLTYASGKPEGADTIDLVYGGGGDLRRESDDIAVEPFDISGIVCISI